MRRRYVTAATQVRPGVQGWRCADRPGDGVGHELQHLVGVADSRLAGRAGGVCEVLAAGRVQWVVRSSHINASAAPPTSLRRL